MARRNSRADMTRTRVFAVLAIGMVFVSYCVSGAAGSQSNGRKLLQETLEGQLLPDVLAAQNSGWKCTGNTCQRSKLSYDDLWLFYKLFYPAPSPPTPPPPEKELVIKRVYGCHDDDDDPTYCNVIDRRIKASMKEIEYAAKKPGVPRVPGLKVTSTPANFEDLRPAPSYRPRPDSRPEPAAYRPAPQRPMNRPQQARNYQSQQGPGRFSNEVPYPQQQYQQAPVMTNPRASAYPSAGAQQPQQRPYMGPAAQGSGNMYQQPDLQMAAAQPVMGSAPIYPSGGQGPGNIYNPEVQMAAAQQVAAAIPDGFFSGPSPGPANSTPGQQSQPPISVTVNMAEPSPTQTVPEPAT